MYSHMYSQPGLYNMQLVMKTSRKKMNPLKIKKLFSTTKKVKQGIQLLEITLIYYSKIIVNTKRKLAFDNKIYLLQRSYGISLKGTI